MLLNIAGLIVEAPFGLLENAQLHFENYQIETGVPDIVVKEDICELGEQLPLFDRVLTHGVAISVADGDGGHSGFIFTAASGTGKSTHAFLWQRLLGKDRVEIINGDKPIISLSEEGHAPEPQNTMTEMKVWGTPWCGKEGLHRNVGVPLRGIGLLHRSTVPRAERATREEFLDFMMEQTFFPRSAEALKRTFKLLEKVYDAVPVYHLYVDMSKKCIEMSVETMIVN